MAQVIIRNLDEEVVQRLKQRARAKGRSLEQELRELLARSAQPDIAEFRRQAATMRERYRARSQTDSALLLREDRDR